MSSRTSCPVKFFAIAIGFAFSYVSVAAAQTAIASSAQPRISAAIDESSLVELRGNVHPLAQSRFDLGPVASSMPASRLFLVLNRSTQQEADLKGYLQSVQDRHSANYHRFLTPEQFGQRFGVDDSDLEIIQGWLAQHGFTVNKLSRSRMVIEFSGNAGQIESTFHTSLHAYAINGVRYWANATDPQIPSALASVVGGFASLSSFGPRAQYIRGPRGTYDPLTHTIRPSYTIGDATNGYYVFLGPADAATVYNTPTTLNPNASGTTYDGTGVTIGIAGDSNIDLTQNADYRSIFGLGANPTTVVIDGADPGENGDAIEAYLDTQVSGGIAPQARVILYTAADTSYQSGLFLAIQRALDDNQIDILNVSFGSCEASLGSSGNQFVNDLWEQAAAQGIAVTVASGDSGSAGCDNPKTETEAVNGLAVNGISSTPFNVSVGGTDFDVLYSNFPASFTTYVDTSNTLAHHRSVLKYIPEEPWNNSTLLNTDIASNYTYSQDMNIEAGGGGVSSVYSLPSWQSTVTSGSGRNLPDVSFLAGNGFYGAVWGICTDLEVDSSGNPVPDCTAGATLNNFNLTGVGGTSASAPAFAGMLALVEQKTESRLGQVDYALYDLAHTSYSSVFHDVTTGDNSVFCALNSPNCKVISASLYEYYLSGYNASTGYDTASGLGSVNAAAMESSWSSPSFAATSSVFALNGSAAPLTITHGQSVSVGDTVTSTSGIPSGEVELVDNLSPATRPNAEGIATFALSNGAVAASTTALPGGSYQVTAHYSGSNTFAQSGSNAIAVTVNPESSTTTLKVAGIYDPATGKSVSTPYYGFIYLLDAQPYGNSSSAANPNGGATGTVTFKAGATSLGSAALGSEGVAELQTATIPGGTNSLTAVFPGDVSFQASTSAPVSYTVAPAVTTLKTPTFTPFDPSVGANETLSVALTVDSAGAGPTGTVSFMNGSASLGTATMVGTAATATAPASGTASLTVTTLPEGANNITAVYSGDANYAGSTSPAAQVTISLNPTTLSFSPANQTIVVNQPLQFTVTPAAVAGLPLPTGTVTAGWGTSNIYYSGSLVNGVASITVPANTFPLGPGSMLVTYSGDKVYSSATAGMPFTVKSSGTATPAVAIIAPTSISAFPVTVTVSVTGPSGDPVATGSVTLTGTPAYLIQIEPLVKGSATFVLNAGIAYGPNTLTATYLGDSTYTAGTATDTLTFLGPADISFSPTSPTISVTDPYSVTVSIATQSPFPAPTGSITLSSGSYTSAATQVASGAASITIPANSLVVGTDTLTATYSGDANYAAGSNTQTIVVTAAPLGLTISAANLTVNAGATTGNTSTITVTPSGGFTGSVALAASITSSPANAQDPPTFSFGSSSPVSITGAAAVTATLTVFTTAPATAALVMPNNAGRTVFAACGTLLACFFLWGIPARRKKWRSILASLLLLVASGAGILACGGTNGGGGGGSGNPGTTPGTYAVKVTATSGNIAATTPLSITVQ
ncbi:MAG TPA: Ig-like domain repeat protein [Acidobacteriaceae bacterium]